MSETYAVPPQHEALAAEHISPDRAIGIGRRVVEQRLNETIDAETSKMNLENERYALKSIPFEDRDKANALLNTHFPPGLKRVLGSEDAGEPGFDLVGYLTQKDRPGLRSDYVVSDGAFANFLEWHNYQLAQKQEKIDNLMESHKEGFKQAIYKAVAEGWAPESAIQHLDRVDTAKVIVDDGFATELAGLHGYTYVDKHGNHMVVAEPSELEDDSSSELAFHEFTHIVAGWDIDPKDLIRRDKPVHGLYRVFGSKGGRIMNEAFDQDFSFAMISGNIDITDPKAPEQKDSRSYYEERELLHTLCTAGARKVDIRLFSAEYFRQPDLSVDLERAQMMHQVFGDPMPDTTDHEPNVQLLEALQQSFPFADVVAEISELHPENKEMVQNYAQSLRERAAAYNASHAERDLK